MDFQFKKNIKIVVNFEIGEEILIKGWGYKLDGKHTIQDFKTNFGHCESGIMVKISGYDSWRLPNGCLIFAQNFMAAFAKPLLCAGRFISTKFN